MPAQIIVNALTKTYRVPIRPAGIKAAFGSLFQRRYEDVHAVCNIDFQIEAGEIVGFIGPNGAGKTTTLKMLSGLLHPTSGSALVDGFTPWERRNDYLHRISMVLGNKSQMLWDIPPVETFRVMAEIYHVAPADYQRTLNELVDLLDMKDLLARPVRSFSLGERMKCELVAGLLHRPRVLFLDEPTLGLDILMQNRLRRFIADYNRLSGATIILTSHYMADVTALCPRVVLIHHGRLVYDGALNRLAEQIAPFKLVRLSLDANGSACPLDLPPGVETLEDTGGHITLRVGRSEAPALTAHLLNHCPITDLTVEDPPLEAVMDRVYSQAVPA